MEEKKSVSEWERIENRMVDDSQVNMSTKVTQKEFREIANKTKFHGVNFEDREEFLSKNGYEVNRNNMRDSSLSAKG